MTQCEIYSTTSNPIHQQDSWFLNVRYRTGTPQEHLNQSGFLLCHLLPSTPTSLGLHHALVGSAFPSRPSQGSQVLLPGWEMCMDKAPTLNRAGCTHSTSHPRDCSPQERQDRGTWQPAAEPFSQGTACQPSVWPSKLASPSSPCPGPCTLPPLCHAGLPQPMSSCLHHPIPEFDLDQEGLSPSCTRRPVATSSLLVLNCHSKNKAEPQFSCTFRGPHNPAAAAVLVTAQPGHLLEMLKLW